MTLELLIVWRLVKLMLRGLFEIGHKDDESSG